MGLFSNLFNRPLKLNIYDLLYAYMRRGTPWGFQPLTWNMKNCFDNHDFSKHWERVLTLNLIQPAEAPDRLEFATIEESRPSLEQFSLKKSGTKADIIQRIMDSGHGVEVAGMLPQVVGLTDTGKSLLAKHDYIPYVIKRCKEIPCGYEKMFEKRERDQSLSKYEVVLFGLNEESFYTDGCYDEEDKGYARDCRREAERDYRDFVKSVASDAKADGIVIDVNRYLN